MLYSGYMDSLSAEDIIRDEIDFSVPAEYTGTLITFTDVGKFNNGQFTKTGTRENKHVFIAILYKGKWTVCDELVTDMFDTIEQVKRRITKVYGTGAKWKITKRI